MKKVFLLLSIIGLFISLFNITFSQKLEKVYSIVKAQKSFEWYKTQAQLWKNEIDKDSKNKEAWMNYYIANRMARLTDHENWNKQKGEYFKDLSDIIKIVEKSIPNTFESLYLKFYNSGDWSEESFKILLKAYSLGPDRTEIFDELVGYYEVKRDIENRDKICSKWFNRNEISSNILNFNFNVISSMDDDGIIITNGDNDTYPIWILQDAISVKKKIQVMNISMITIDEYRDKIFQENGIPKLNIDNSELKKENRPDEIIKQKILKHIVEHSTRPVYIALTLDQNYYKDIKDNLYIVGLALKYSKSDLDNIALLRRNYEKNFLIDYLKMNFYNDISSSIVEQMNMCYLAGFIKLFEHYKASGEEEKTKELKNLILRIAKDSEKEEEINQWIKSFKIGNDQ